MKKITNCIRFSNLWLIYSAHPEPILWQKWNEYDCIAAKRNHTTTEQITHGRMSKWDVNVVASTRQTYGRCVMEREKRGKGGGENRYAICWILLRIHIKTVTYHIPSTATACNLFFYKQFISTFFGILFIYKLLRFISNVFDIIHVSCVAFVSSMLCVQLVVSCCSSVRFRVCLNLTHSSIFDFTKLPLWQRFGQRQYHTIYHSIIGFFISRMPHGNAMATTITIKFCIFPRLWHAYD